jgi:hypothetical protein
MIGVTLRYKWISCAIFMVPVQIARPPIREAIIKKIYPYHRDRAPWLDKNTQSLVYFKKSASKIVSG